MRRLIAGVLLRIHVWAAKDHKPFMPLDGIPRCPLCHERWPCRVRVETDMRQIRFGWTP